MLETMEWAWKLGISAVLVGLLLWALKGWWAEKTRPRSAKDQVPTWEEIGAWLDDRDGKFLVQKDLTGAVDRIEQNCKECIRACNARRNQERTNEMTHFATLFKQQLDQGEKRFQTMEMEQTKTREVLTDISTNLALLTQTVDRALDIGKISFERKRENQ
jgi:hypothetical protein